MKDDQTPLRCADPRCDDVAAIMATSALGGNLVPDEQQLMLAYLSTCERCRLRLGSYANVAGVLPLAAAEAEPSPVLRGRILEAAAGRSRLDRRTRLRPAGWGWRSALSGALGVVALALALLLAQQQAHVQTQQAEIARLAGQIERQQQNSARNRALVVAAFGNDDAIEGYLKASGAVPDASGQIFLSPGTPAAAVYARHLPQLAEGRVYQVWLLGGGSLRSLGTFRPDANGRAWAILQPDGALPQPEAIVVTEEAGTTGVRPAGPELLRAEFP